MKALIYSRVSTADQAEGTSLESQASECVKYAQSLGYEIAHITKEIFSGADLFERPKLNEQREKIKNGSYDALVIYAVDRLSRDIAHLAIICNELERYNTKLLIVTEQLDDTPEGKLMLSVKGFVAEVERAKIRERTMRGKRTKIAQGKFIPAGNLFGYEFNKETGKREIIESEAMIVRAIFNSVLSGNSLRSITERLNNSDDPPPSAKNRTYKDGRSALWRMSTMHRIVHEPSYCGRTFVLRFKRVQRFKNGKKVFNIILRDRSEWIELPGVTPPVVSVADWEAVQTRLSENGGELIKNEKKFYLLRGLVFCAVCGKKMYADLSKGRRVYRCAARAVCRAKSINADRAEAKIWRTVELSFDNPQYFEADLKKKRGSKIAESKLMKAQKALQRINAEIENYISRAGTATNSTWSVFQKHIEEKEKERSAVLELIKHMENESLEAENKKTSLLTLAQQIKLKVADADNQTKRLILEALGAKMFANGKNIELYTNFTV